MFKLYLFYSHHWWCCYWVYNPGFKVISLLFFKSITQLSLISVVAYEICYQSDYFFFVNNVSSLQYLIKNFIFCSNFCIVSLLLCLNQNVFYFTTMDMVCPFKNSPLLSFLILILLFSLYSLLKVIVFIFWRCWEAFFSSLILSSYWISSS